MNYTLYVYFSGDDYHVRMRGAIIVEILCNGQPVTYDDLSLSAREAILIEALAKLNSLNS